jgi:hypothetical protein
VNADDRSQIVFGGFDGLSSALGVIAGGLAVHSRPRTILAVAGSLAVAAAVSMAEGEWLGDVQRVGRLRRAALMGVATLVGSALPALGFLGGRSLGIAVAIASTVAVGVAVAALRPGRLWPSLARSLAFLAVGAGLSVLVGAVLGAA